MHFQRQKTIQDTIHNALFVIKNAFSSIKTAFIMEKAIQNAVFNDKIPFKMYH